MASARAGKQVASYQELEEQHRRWFSNLQVNASYYQTAANSLHGLTDSERDDILDQMTRRNFFEDNIDGWRYIVRAAKSYQLPTLQALLSVRQLAMQQKLLATQEKLLATQEQLLQTQKNIEKLLTDAVFAPGSIGEDAAKRSFVTTESTRIVSDVPVV